MPEFLCPRPESYPPAKPCLSRNIQAGASRRAGTGCCAGTRRCRRRLLTAQKRLDEFGAGAAAGALRVVVMLRPGHALCVLRQLCKRLLCPGEISGLQCLAETLEVLFE